MVFYNRSLSFLLSKIVTKSVSSWGRASELVKPLVGVWIGGVFLKDGCRLVLSEMNTRLSAVLRNTLGERVLFL